MTRLSRHIRRNEIPAPFVILYLEIPGSSLVFVVKIERNAEVAEQFCPLSSAGHGLWLDKSFQNQLTTGCKGTKWYFDVVVVPIEREGLVLGRGELLPDSVDRCGESEPEMSQEPGLWSVIEVPVCGPAVPCIVVPTATTQDVV